MVQAGPSDLAYPDIHDMTYNTVPRPSWSRARRNGATPDDMSYSHPGGQRADGHQTCSGCHDGI